MPSSALSHLHCGELVHSDVNDDHHRHHADIGGPPASCVTNLAGHDTEGDRYQGGLVR